jgi:hypothetical protein
MSAQAARRLARLLAHETDTQLLLELLLEIARQIGPVITAGLVQYLTHRLKANQRNNKKK